MADGEARPEVVSFHFGLPAARLLDRVKRTGAKVLASATIVAEARWLAERGVDAIVAMGAAPWGRCGAPRRHAATTTSAHSGPAKPSRWCSRCRRRH